MLDRLVVKSDSANVVKWVSGVKKPQWKLITVVKEIKALLIGQEISFLQISRLANGVRDFFCLSNELIQPSRESFTYDSQHKAIGKGCLLLYTWFL